MRWFRTKNGLLARQLGRDDIEIEFYETYTLNLVNSGTANMNGIVRFARYGNMVVYSADAPITHDSSNAPAASDDPIPESFWPNSFMDNCYIYDATSGRSSRINNNGIFQLIYSNEGGGVAGTSSQNPPNGSYFVET